MFCLITLVTKVLFQVGLLVVFVYFFGIPSVQRYIAGEVLTVNTVSHPGKVLPPTVTVVTSKASDSGWEDLEKVCRESEAILLCIQKNTRNMSETIHAELGFTLRESLMAPKLWREDFSVPRYGRSYTLAYPHVRGDNWRTDAINLHVNNSDGLTRRIFIHDPDTFVVNVNPLALPNNVQTVAPHAGRVYLKSTGNSTHSTTPA